MRITLISLILLFARIVYSQPAIPDHGGYWVHDEADILSVQRTSRLERILQAERDSTSNQIAILIIPSLDGNALEEYSLRVAEAWKLGKSDKDNGVLLLISVNDRKMRIETGYGLEGALTDAIASRIIRNEIAPRFRNGDYEGGVEAGVMAIIQAIRGEYVNEEPVVKKRNSKKSPWLTIIIIIIIIIITSRSRRGGGGGGHWSSGRGWIGPVGGMGGGSWGSGSGGGFGGSFGGGGGFGGGGSSGSW
ncbi:TPM domain-containing protein [Chryseolinea sp. H1M3-3]|uniref:TPM domain-containing protein n=1 Tax=Chryseolinea sp. H1M3-3 TaxID=3034144 RepID=UPI0023EB1E17|nr:TPM domain-containing protein [Chryseolinea sp. H1M3-3]